jgi:hypothetical protein
MGRHVAHMGVGRPEGKKPLGRPRCRWEDNIKINVEKGNGVECTGLSFFKIRRGGRFLWNEVIKFGFRKMWDIS